VMRLVTEMSNDNSYEKTSLFWTLYRYSIIASDTTDNDTMKAILDDIKKISNELLKTESDIEIKSQLNKVNSVIDAHQNPDALFKEIRGLLLNLAVIRISLEDRHPSSELYKQNIVEADQTFEKLDLILEPIKEIYEWKTPEYGNDLLNKNELSELTFLLEKGSRVSLDQTEFIRLKQLQLKRFPSSLISRHTTNENVVLEINEEEIVSSFSKGYSKKNPFEQPPSKIFSEKFQWLLTRLLNDIFQSYRQGAYEFLPTGNGSQLKQAVTLSHNNFVDGTSLIPVSLLAYQVLRPDVHQVNYEDVRRFLRQEIAGSYEMLSQEFVEHGEISNITETSKSRKDIEGVTPSQPVVDILTGSSMQVRMTRSKKKKKPPTEKSETIVFETYRHHIDMMEFWRTHCSQDLVNAVKSVRRKGEDALDDYFDFKRDRLFDKPYDRYKNQTPPEYQRQRTLSQHRYFYYSDLKNHFPEADFSTTAYLGWQVILESALLNERLKQDMREIEVEKGCPCLNHNGIDFYGPRPSIEARQAFNQYVRCRWPVKVFALDPVTDDQNVGSAFSQRRELQMAVAIGFSQGLFSAQNLDRYVRRLEYDLETIELNRTSVGYAFGEDTFGWRFYPRVQTPPVPGNLETKFRDLLIGGRNREQALRDRMLEAGMRECTALVVMPSFIPYMCVDIQTNYFKIGKDLFHKPFKRKNDLSDAVGLSRELTEVRNLVHQCVQDQHLYRPEEIAHLQRAINRIDHQLPLQSEMIQVPYENTLSGFEAFNSGISDLGPQLLDWYGAPGILVATGNELPPGSNLDVTTKDTTTSKLDVQTEEKRVISDANPLGPTQIFLIGKNFTSLGEGTRVIAGGMDVTDSKKVVNRDIISVLVPSSVMTSEVKIKESDDPKYYVDVHLATPHGVTSRIRVPAIEPPAAKKANVQLAAVSAKLEAIEKKVEAVDARQITKVTWAEKKNEGTLKVCIDSNSTPRYVVSIEKNSSLKIPACAFAKDVKAIDVAFQVEVSTDEKEFKKLTDTDTDNKEFYIPFPNSIPVTLDADGTPTAAINRTDLQGLIDQAMRRSNYQKADIKAIRVLGCLRLRNTKHADIAEWPVYKIDDYLEIKITTFDACVTCNNAKCTCQQALGKLSASQIWPPEGESKSVKSAPIKELLLFAPPQSDRIALPLLPDFLK